MQDETWPGQQTPPARTPGPERGRPVGRTVNTSYCVDDTRGLIAWPDEGALDTAETATSETQQGRRKRTQFWSANSDDDSLVREVLSGRKTATVCKADEYHVPMNTYDDGGMEVGDLVDVYDQRGRFRCVIRVTEVYPVEFGAVPEKLWRAECCESAEHFRDVHRCCWPDDDLSDTFEMIATHFELVQKV